MRPVRFNRRAFLRSVVASNAAAIAAAVPKAPPVPQNPAGAGIPASASARMPSGYAMNAQNIEKFKERKATPLGISEMS